MKINRRQFVQQTAGVAMIGALETSASAGADTQASLAIVDTHQHLWDLKKFELPWVKTAGPLARSFVTKDYLAATDGQNVVKTVYMEVDVTPSQQVAEARHVIELCKSTDHPTAAAVISGRPNSKDFKPYITQFKGSPYIKGVRQVLHAPNAKKGLCLEKQFVASMRLLGELGMSFDLCMRPTELADGARLARQCPDTRFIVDHCGNGDPKAFRSIAGSKPWHDTDQWRRDMELLAGQKNVVCKISGIIARADKETWKPDDLAPIINHCWDVFGTDRVMFGGDWPVCTLVAPYRDWVSALKQVISSRSIGDQRKLFSENALAFYGLA